MNIDQLRIKAVRHAGLLVGCILGLLSGLHIFGIAVGALVGYFIDELLFTRRVVNKSAFLFAHPSAGVISDRWTRNVISVALACSTAEVSTQEQRVGLADKILLENKLSNRLARGGREVGLVKQLIEAFFKTEPEHIAQLDELARVYKTISTKEENLSLLELLIDTTPGEIGRISSGQNEKLKSISVSLDVSPASFNALRKAAVVGDTEAYEIIGVTPDADDSEIHRVYRRLAAQFHPDTSSDLEAEQRERSKEAFLKIQEAYDRIIADRSALRTDEENGSDSS